MINPARGLVPDSQYPWSVSSGLEAPANREMPPLDKHRRCPNTAAAHITRLWGKKRLPSETWARVPPRLQALIPTTPPRPPPHTLRMGACCFLKQGNCVFGPWRGGGLLSRDKVPSRAGRLTCDSPEWAGPPSRSVAWGSKHGHGTCWVCSAGSRTKQLLCGGEGPSHRSRPFPSQMDIWCLP